MRGASRNPTAPASTAAGSTRADCMSAWRPGPARARERPQPRGGQRAVLVDERDDVGDRRQRDEVERTGDRRVVVAEERRGRACSTTPVPQSSGNGYADGRVATIGQSGSASPGRWWSVTMTSSPSSRAAATSSTAVMPQSTVSTRPTPSAARRSIVSRGEAVALLEAARQVPFDVRPELPQGQHGERGRADPVDVVVAVDADPLAGRDRRADAVDRRGHVAERERVVPGRLRLEERARRRRLVVVPAGRARSRSSRSRRARRRAPRRDPSHTVEWSSGPPASPRRRYGPSRTASHATTCPTEAGHPSGQRGCCGGEAAAFRDVPRRRRGSSGGIPLLRNPASRSKRSSTLATELHDHLDPQHHDRRRRADHAHGDRREERHLLERVLRHGCTDEPDDEHGSDHHDDQATILHTLQASLRSMAEVTANYSSGDDYIARVPRVSVLVRRRATSRSASRRPR